ncbi:hypothetical protein I79_019026 [Cricetulus griseus]|uniref:Uncharacterized protein n=1 Tax=Cricetulus griseus TaxID=10029 RepID=G3I6B3_CRIGR|nr:hypothetical protein I79_019026 [Cricetulus griseus]
MCTVQATMFGVGCLWGLCSYFDMAVFSQGTLDTFYIFLFKIFPPTVFRHLSKLFCIPSDYYGTSEVV